VAEPPASEHLPADRRAALLRAAVAVWLSAFVAVLGALVLGEYELEGTMPFVAAPLLGLVVAEVLVGIGGCRAVALGVLAAVLSGGAIVGAGWIDAGNGVEPVKAGVWPAASVAAVVAGVRAGAGGRARG
jgi:hypothetical protein